MISLMTKCGLCLAVLSLLASSCSLKDSSEESSKKTISGVTLFHVKAAGRDWSVRISPKPPSGYCTALYEGTAFLTEGCDPPIGGTIPLNVSSGLSTDESHALVYGVTTDEASVVTGTTVKGLRVKATMAQVPGRPIKVFLLVSASALTGISVLSKEGNVLASNTSRVADLKPVSP
jgi:hypothetical protein